MPRGKRTFAIIPQLRRAGGKSATPVPTWCAATPRTRSKNASPPKRGSSLRAARSTKTSGTRQTTTRKNRSRSASTPHAGWRTGRSPVDRSRPAPASTTSEILDDHLVPTFGHRQLAVIKPKDVRDWHATTLVDKPTMRVTPTGCCARFSRQQSTTSIIDANPARIVGAGRAKRVHKIRPASVAELGVLTAAMPERLQLMVTLASWCALRFGETVELRRGDIDLSAEVIRIRRAAVRTKGAYSITTPKSDAGVRDVAIPPHIIPSIEAHLAKHVDNERDSLIFPA